MTLDDLARDIAAARWFSNLGQFRGAEGAVALRTLEAWRGADAVVDAHHDRVADEMSWLPADNSEPDMIRGDELRVAAARLGAEAEVKEASLKVYQLALASLREVADSGLLKAGPHDFNKVAQGAACYAARRAAAEIVLGQQGFWCALIPLYRDGNFPLGILPNGHLVVF